MACGCGLKQKGGKTYANAVKGTNSSSNNKASRASTPAMKKNNSNKNNKDLKHQLRELFKSAKTLLFDYKQEENDFMNGSRKYGKGKEYLEKRLKTLSKQLSNDLTNKKLTEKQEKSLMKEHKEVREKFLNVENLFLEYKDELDEKKMELYNKIKELKDNNKLTYEDISKIIGSTEELTKKLMGFLYSGVRRSIARGIIKNNKEKRSSYKTLKARKSKIEETLKVNSTGKPNN